ncbi:uncharacterized protein LOC128149163 [Harpia harpyja]|uniref:uncharacterized protein LOC128149163 n=1 Tax=Harpia harpyja TaxID=202280 RepID=UPI0022B0E760|nr:uncharacterized protein LOC128149163 [Harpia harpyja]
MYQPQRQVLAALLGQGTAYTGTPGPYSRRPVTEKPIREHRLRREEGPALEAVIAAPRYPEETIPVAGTDAARGKRCKTPPLPSAPRSRPPLEPALRTHPPTPSQRMRSAPTNTPPAPL